MKRSRYFETARLMDEAFLAQLQEKPLELITAKEVCIRAGVSRSTFYLHYESMTDLLEESVHYILERFFSQFGTGASDNIQTMIDKNDRSEMFLIIPKYLRPYLEFVRENRLLFLTMIDNSSALGLQEVYADIERTVIAPILSRFNVLDRDKEYFEVFYLHGCMAVIEKWIRSECKDSIDRIILIMEHCCGKDRVGPIN